MKLIGWMLAGSLLSALGVTPCLRPEIRLEWWLGMLGPLAASAVSWAAIQRRYARHPEGFTALMVRAFAAKMVFYAGYVTVLVGTGSVRPVPFATSFTCYFIALHAAGAIGLCRMQSSGALDSPEALQGRLRNG